MKHKFYYIALDLVVPGLGQLSAKRYVRGALQAVLAIGATLWFAWELMMPFINFYNDGDILADKLPEIKFISALMPMLLFSAVLTWSIIDIMFGFDKTNCKKKYGENQ